MFPVIVNDGTQEIPPDDICYIVAKEGIFLKKKMGVMESIAPVKNISILQSVNTMARMHINPLPAQTGAKILEFFKAVYQEYHGEAIVLLFYNEASGKYRIIPPKQKVTAAACDYEREVQVPGFQMIGTIHSHGSMSAFHSGTDDDDEKSFDGLHITYGNVMQDEFSLSASIVANGFRFMVNPEDYMLGLSKTKDVDEKGVNYATKVYKWVAGKMVLDEKASSRTAYTTRRFDKRFVFNVVPSKRQFNPAWMENVEKGTYTYNYYGYGGAYDWRQGNYWNQQGRGGSRRWNGWGSAYDRSAWNQVGRGFTNPALPPPPVGGKVAPGSSPLNVGPASKTTPVQFPQHQQPAPPYDPERPCLSCKHRDCKIMDEMQDIDYEEEMYLCEKCKSIITTEDANVVCPNCKTDEHLVMIDEEDLKDNHVRGNPGNFAPRVKILDDIDREAYLNSAQSMQPDQLGKVTCLECGNDFHLLKTDECCPYCHTLLPDTVKADDNIEQEWECPYCKGFFGESEILCDNHCPHCNGLIDISAIAQSEDDEILVCPKCQTENTLKSLEEIGSCYSCGSPAVGMREEAYQMEEQMRTDSGAYLDQTDEEHEAILKAAAEADKTLERIPDPEKGPNQPTPLTTAEKIKQAMAKVFGGTKGNDTIH